MSMENQRHSAEGKACETGEITGPAKESYHE